MEMTDRRVVLLDRDGTINRRVDGGYVTSWEGFEFLPGALESLVELAGAGFALVVVTNQAAVDKGLLSLAELDRIHQRMTAAIEGAGARLAGIYACPHAPAAGCTCRKPRPGLLQRAAAELGFDLTASYMVGDSPSDIEAGLRAGCRTILIEAGRSGRDPESRWQPHHVVPDLAAAVRLLVSADSRLAVEGGSSA